MSTLNNDIIEILRCPNSKSPLTLQGPALKAEKGQREYGFLDDIAWLFKNPQAALHNWQSQARQFLVQMENKIETIKLELKRPGLLEKTQQRLSQMQLALESNINEYNELFQPLLEAPVSELLIEEVLAERQPFTQTLRAYSDNVFRDWAWGHEENKVSIEILLNVLEARPIENMVVLGAGACKLPMSLHKLLVQNWTLAIDINPFLLLTAKRMLTENSLHLFEFPLAPIEAKNQSVQHELKGEVAENFHLLFADAINMPLKNESTDCIFTPWFCDIVFEDIAKLAQRINRPLKKGGIWLQFGPLGYGLRSESEKYSAEEVLEIVESKGFKIKKYSIERIPYLKSPFSGQNRQEKVLSFVAEKIDSQKELPDFNTWPAWITNFDQPIPQLPVIEDLTFKNRVQFEVLSSVNGSQSLNSLADLMSQHYGMDKKSALNSLVAFFTEIYESKVRPQEM